jgi:lauroyl/myristoyl acyltransferase
VRQEDGRYHLILGEPLFTPGRDDKTAADIVRSFVTLLEKCVEKHTEQWYFFQRVGERGRPYA